jgi:hypothetical protein
MIATAHRQAGEATPGLLARLEQLETEARRLYDDQADQHVRRALRALASLRMAVEARLDSKTGGVMVPLRFVGSSGDPIAVWHVERDRLMAFYGVPLEHWDDQLRVQMRLGGNGPDVTVYRDGQLVWLKEGVGRAELLPDPLPEEQDQRSR